MRVMNALTMFTLLLLLVSPASAATKEDILKLMPPGTPVLIIDDSPAKTLSSLKSLAGTAVAEGGSEVDELFMRLGLEKAPGGLDIYGPAAVAMPQFPFPLVVLTVTDYPLFIEGLRGGPPAEGNPPPVSPAPGIDALNLGGKPVFARQEGDLALLTPMALLLGQPAAAGLAPSLHPGESSILAESGTFVRLDVAMLMAFLEPMMQQFIAGAGAAPPPIPEGKEPTEEQQAQVMAANILKAEVELLMAGLRQVRSLSLGVAGSEGGATLRSIWVPRPESGFASLLTEPKGADARTLLRHFDEGAFFNAVVGMDTASFKGMFGKMTDFMFDTGIYNLAPEDREAWQSFVETSFEIVGDASAFSMGSSSGGGAISMLAIGEVKDSEKMRTLMRDSFSLSKKLLASSPGLAGADMKMELVPASETYRGVVIDKMSFDIRPPEVKDDPAFDSYMESMFGGPSLSLWFAFHDDRMIASYYNATADGLKKLIDRVLDDTGGTLTSSESFREATAGLPSRSSFFSYYSVPRMVESFAGAVMSALPGDMPPMTFGLEGSSGFGSAWFSTGDALRTETFMPRAELDNYRAMADYFKAVGAKKAEGGGAPAIPAPPPRQ